MIPNYFSRLYNILKTDNKDVYLIVQNYRDIEINYKGKYLITFFI